MEEYFCLRDAHEKLPIHDAAASGSLNCLRVLTLCPFLVNERDSEGSSPLHLAASNKHTWVPLMMFCLKNTSTCSLTQSHCITTLNAFETLSRLVCCAIVLSTRSNRI